ncbi:MAG: RelA/SpoT family protein [Culturomica sp.]|nr:RelA/SpoT family protein [Culturomica sp.]
MTEEESVQSAFDELMSVLRPGTTEENRQLIVRAFEFAKEAHKGTIRRSGEPYILHPIAVARIAAKEIGLGTKSVIAALLHDVVEDTDYTVEDIANLYGPKIASLVDGLTKIGEVMGADTSRQAESFRKMLLTLADDVRVILIKIADRLHNMRTLASMSLHKQVKIAGETLYIYAPLANRLGLHAIKTELEDLSLKYEHPDEYQVIHEKITTYSREYSDLLERFVGPIRENLDANGYVYTMTARTKSVYSVWMKMQKQNVTIDGIYDLLAVRIVFDPKPEQPEKWQCWNIYSLITDLYRPKPERIRDWISTPKANGYEALHLTVMGPAGQWFEVQIRSKRMDEIAERGLAAHWKYKGEGAGGSQELDRWLDGVKEALANQESGALEFLDEFKLNLFDKEIRVFTPKGHMKTLPKESSVLDFAYEIHTEIGNTCIGGKVNHKLVPMSHRLKSGDQVEVLTSDKQTPQKEWLEWVVTAKAKSHIQDVFRKDYKEALREGIEIFEGIVRELKLPPNSEPLRKVLEHFRWTNKDDLYAALGRKNLSREEVIRELKKRQENKFMKFWTLRFLWNDNKDTKKGKGERPPADEAEAEAAGAEIVVAPCCNPIPGDDVVGISMGGKVTVHKRKCPEAIRLMSSYGDKIVPVEWVKEQVISFPATLRMSGIDRVGMVSDVTTVISKENGVNMRTVHFETKAGVWEGSVQVYVRNTGDLNRLMENIRALPGVREVVRLETADS